MFNTIVLKKGEGTYTRNEWERFKKGNTILGCDSEPEEIKRWSIDHKEEAQEELKKYRCRYFKDANFYYVEEYALEYCECDNDEEFISGSDYDLAEEEKE